MAKEPSKAVIAFDHDIDADEAMLAVQSQRDVGELDAATGRRILRRIDMVMMPLLCVVYGLNYLDSNPETTLSYASVTGIKQDLGLTGDDYNWLASIFYFGYLGFEYPAVRLLQHLPLAKYSAFCVVAWGLTLVCFIFVKDFAGAVVIRLLLGIFEASVSPGWALFTSQWYTKQEQSVRTAWWISFNGFAQIFGGLVAYGIARHSKAEYTIAPWKIIYIFTGTLTIAVGIAFAFVMPDSQLNAWWLNDRDRILAVERVRINQQGIGNRHFKLYQFIEAFHDPMTWAFIFLALFGNIPNGGLSNFFNLLIESFGYTAEQSLLYGTISGAVEVVVLLGWAYMTRSQSRILWAVVGLIIALIGACLIVALPLHNNTGRLAGFYLAQSFVIGVVVLISMLVTNLAGYTKKTTVSGLFFVAYCVGNIIGPQTYRPQDAPRYLSAEIVLIVCYGLCILDLLFIYWYYCRMNKAKAATRALATYQKLENQEFLDLTDRENPEFIYVL